MSILDHAIEHVRAKRHVFPGLPGKKIPAVANPYSDMTLDEKKIMRWWKENPNYNICIPAGIEIEPGKFLGVIDVDVKNANGFETISQLDMIGLEFPETLEQCTPSKGLHKLYYFDHAIGNGVNSIGPGIDHRGFHGYVLGAGSWYEGKEYTFKNHLPIVDAPLWVAEKVDHARIIRPKRLEVVPPIDQEQAARRAKEFLDRLEISTEGSRNHDAYKIAARIKDFGVEQLTCSNLMANFWKCEPPLDSNELQLVINSAYTRSENPVGILAPEVQFEVVPPPPMIKTPIEVINDEYFFVTLGGYSRICHETKNEAGEYHLNKLTVPAFHDRMAASKLTGGDGKTLKISNIWMDHPDRRSYYGIVFHPINILTPNYYNLWRGFAVTPAGLGEVFDVKAQESVDAFLDHIYENVAEENEAHYNWIIGWFAHLVQDTGDKPEVSLVMRGGKGVGKNAIIDRISYLLGDHSVVVSDRRYLLGNFNSILENKLLFTLDEAFWSGDKASEGVLKALITGKKKVIEHKGSEPYVIKSCERICILGNEDWVVPASNDERRFAVFDVGNKRQNDRAFFTKMRVGMEKHGGARLLLRFLMDFDLSCTDVNVAPKTKALIEQKEESMGFVQSWWRDSLREGRILGHPAGLEDWPTEMVSAQLYECFHRHMQLQPKRWGMPTSKKTGRILNQIAPGLKTMVRNIENHSTKVRIFSPLDKARLEWEKYIGGPVNWEE